MIIGWLITKLVIVSLLAILAEITRRTVRAECAYGIWLATLLLLLVPPVVHIPVIPQAAISSFAQEAAPIADDNALLGQNIPSATRPKLDSVARTDTTETPVVARVDSLVWTSLVLTVWGIGTLLLAWRSLRQHFLLARLVGSVNAANQNVTKLLEHEYNSMGLKCRSPIVAIVDGAFSPFLWHPLRGTPTIVLPIDLVTNLSDESLQTILRHELVHLKRRDARRHLIETIAVALWWWFPVVWLARKRLHALAEICTDSQIVLLSPHLRTTYANALLNADEFLLEARQKLQPLPAFTGQNLLKTRIELIMNKNTKRWHPTVTRIFTIAACLCVVPFGALAVGTAQESTTSPQDSKSRLRVVRNKSVRQHGKITIKRRRQTEYGQSAYSFRYKTQDKSVHKNHVDLVYSTDGMMRFNNHGGLNSLMARLGETKSLDIPVATLRNAKWSKQNVKPVEGETYALNIVEQGVSMPVIFRLVELTPEKMEIVWSPTKYKWPVSIDRRGMAGESGMNAYRSRSRSDSRYRSGR